MAEGVSQEFREQVQVPESEQEYPERVGLDRFQRGRRREQEAEEGVPQEFREPVQAPGLEQGVCSGD